MCLYNFLDQNSEKCSKDASGGTPGDGDGLSKGNCPKSVCQPDGKCKGIYFYKKYVENIGNYYYPFSLSNLRNHCISFAFQS